MSTDFMQAFLRPDMLPTCPACFLGTGKRMAGLQVEMKVVQVGAAHKDGRVFVGYVALCPECGLAVPLQQVERRPG